MVMLKKLLFSFRRLWPIKKSNRRVFLVFGLLVIPFLLFIYYLISFYLVKPEEICLAELKKSWEENEACHEACALERASGKRCLINSLKNSNLNGTSRLERKIVSYFQNEGINTGFRLQLVDILKEAYGSFNIPICLSDYLSREEASIEIKTAIFQEFDWSKLASSSGMNVLDYYFSVLESDTDLNLRLAAAVKIGSYKNKKNYFTLDQIREIKTLILDDKLDPYLRQSLVLLLGDYLDFFKEETKLILSEIYATEFSEDNISRAFAADLLGEPMPEISQEEWQKYYNR